MNQPGTPSFVERRLMGRLKANAKDRVKVVFGEKSAICEIYNVSVGGLCLKNVGMSLGRGVRVELRYMLSFSNGTTRIHLRHATVVWTFKGLTGFAVDTVPPKR